MACRGFEPARVVDLVRSDAARRQANPEEPPSEVTSYEIENWEDDQQVAQLVQSVSACWCLFRWPPRADLVSSFSEACAEPFIPEELALLTRVGKHVGVRWRMLAYTTAEQTAITAERNRLARELHDAVTQTCFQPA